MGDVPIYPVIMCGGSGTRLWPSSRPARPKQFLPLTGERSLFQETVLRMAPLANGGGRLVIVAGVAHASLIGEQLAAIGATADVLTEPEPRDSAAAIAAAACWIARSHPDGVAAIVASDHHVPDHDAFRSAIGETLAAAEAGSIVTLGVRPTAPSTAYGYIRAGAAAQGRVRSVEAFVEKPDAATAATYVAEGYVWNSGNFVATAATLLAELSAHSPEIVRTVQAGLAEAVAEDGAVRLGDTFRSAPKISFDYAVMEKTRQAAVLPVSWAWSDVGAWDAVWAASAKDAHGASLSPGSIAPASTDVMIRAPAGLRVAAIGVERLAIIVEPDAVLVCSFDHAQGVKAVAEAAAPGSREAWTLRSIPEAADWFRSWLETAALPLWATLGVDEDTGGFREGLTPAGGAYDPHRRVRVQARQAMVYAQAAAEGRPGPWRAVAERGAAWLQAKGRGRDGLYVTCLRPDGGVEDATPRLYEQAFVLMSLATLGGDEAHGEAHALRRALEGLRHPKGGFREAGPHPFQANAHMHLLEAAMMWEGHDAGGGWDALADEIVDLALARFIDPETGLLNEFFDDNWRALQGDAGLIEPGHHFEWAWLLSRWASARRDDRAAAPARRLYALGLQGVDVRRGVAVNSLWSDGRPRDASARLWPQTEFLKAALALGEPDDVLAACNAIRRYLDVGVRGLWRDRMKADGAFIVEPAPASSFYHLHLAIRELETAHKARR